MPRKKRSAIGRQFKSGNDKNKKHPTSNRLLVTPSQVRNHQSPTIISIENENESVSPSSKSKKPYSTIYRVADRIKDLILKNNLSNSDRVHALKKALTHDSLKEIVKDAGITFNQSDSNNVAVHNFNQMKKLITFASLTQNSRGRPNDDQRSLVESTLVSISNSPSLSNNAPTIYKLSKELKIPKSSAYRKLGGSQRKRKIIFANELDLHGILCSHVKKRKKYSKVSPSLIEKIQKWIYEHPYVITSPLAKDTLLIKNPNDDTQTIRVAKYLRQISIRELHNDLTSETEVGLPDVYDSNKNLLVSDTCFRSLIPPNVKYMSSTYKQNCGCEICIMSKSYQNDLNQYRLSYIQRLRNVDNNQSYLYRNRVYPNGVHLHPHPRDAVRCITCAHVEGFNVPPMKCILRRCLECPKLKPDLLEQSLTELDPFICFHNFVKITKCSIHGQLNDGIETCDICESIDVITSRGRISQRKEMILMKKSFLDFYNNFYIPMLNKYAYHLPHVILLGKNECSKIRKESLKIGDVETIRDYAERLSFDFDNEIMSQHFGNSLSLSMEGVFVRYLDNSSNLTNVSKSEFHSHMSESKIQNAGSTNQHMITLLDILRRKGKLEPGSTLFCNCDGAAKQYRCANALYYLSCLAFKYNISIDRAICAPGHGKDVVDGLNAVDKHYLKQVMRRTKTAQETNDNIKKIQIHTIEDDQHASIAEEAARLCILDRTKGAISFRKYQKRENNKVMEARFYHVREERHNVIEYVNMKTIGFPKKKDGEKYHGLMACYHLHVDKDLGPRKAAVRRIPCNCQTCSDKLKTKWMPNVAPKDQPRFQRNDVCRYKSIFQEYNDWIIVELDYKKANDTNDLEELHKDVLMGIQNVIADNIRIGKFGAYLTYSRTTGNHYEIVKWVSEPYTKQDSEGNERSNDVRFVDVKQCDVSKTNKRMFHVRDQIETIRLQHVLKSDIEVDKSVYHRRVKKKSPISISIEQITLSDETHDEITEEIMRRELIDYNEEVDEDDH